MTHSGLKRGIHSSGTIASVWLHIPAHNLFWIIVHIPGKYWTPCWELWKCDNCIGGQAADSVCVSLCGETDFNGRMEVRSVRAEQSPAQDVSRWRRSIFSFLWMHVFQYDCTNRWGLTSLYQQETLSVYSLQGYDINRHQEKPCFVC